MRSANAVAAGVAAANYKHLFALGGYEVFLVKSLTHKDSRLLRKDFEGEVNALQFATFDFQIPCLRSACCNDVSVKSCGEIVDINILIINELDALLLHQRDAAVDDILGEFEIGDAKPQQSARSLVFLIDRNVKALLVQLIGGRKTRRTRTNYKHLLAVACISLRRDVTLHKSALDDCALVFAASYRFGNCEVQDARLFAQSRTNPARKLRKIVGLAEEFVRQLPIALVERVVPFGLFVAEGTSPMAKRYAAIHTARGLLLTVFCI